MSDDFLGDVVGHRSADASLSPTYTSSLRRILRWIPEGDRKEAHAYEEDEWTAARRRKTRNTGWSMDLQ